MSDLAHHEVPESIIVMFVAAGVPDRIRPEDVVRAEGELHAAYAERQALAVELWSIPDNT